MELRKKVDELDDKIIELLKTRFEIVKQIGEHKIKHKLPIEDLEREKEILTKIDDNNIIKIYDKIFTVSKKLQGLEFYTFGESHGKVIGVLVLDVPVGISLSETDVQVDLDKRKPGQSDITTQRKEEDKVEILSGVLDGKTTGTPLCMMIKNKDYDSSTYEHSKFRPGHADFSYFKKFRQLDKLRFMSGRETASRVMAGAIAKKLIDVKVYAYAKQIGNIVGSKVDLNFIEKNKVKCADYDKCEEMITLIKDAKEKGDSVGGIVDVIVKNVPAGIGEPHLNKLDAKLAEALMSIPAIKAVEFGSMKMFGSENNDEITSSGFLSNNSGGILGGISTGQEILITLKVKPTPSIRIEQKTIDKEGRNTTIKIKGRHDPCIIPRIIPVVESMVAITLARFIK